MALQRTGKKQIDMQNRKGKKGEKSQRMKKRKMGWPAAFRQFRTAVKTSSCPQPWAIAMSCERIGKSTSTCKKRKGKKGKKPKKENKVAFASLDTYYLSLSCSLVDIGATLLSSPWQRPLVMLLSSAQTQQLSRQITANQ